MRTETENEFNLFDYILNNVDTISKEGFLDKSILDSLSGINLKTFIPTIKFKLKSTNGIENIKKMIDIALTKSNTKDILEVMIEASPNYYVLSKETIDTTPHEKFISALKELAQNQENNIYMSL